MKKTLKKLGNFLVGRKTCLLLALVAAIFFAPHFAFAATPSSADTSTLVKDLADFLAIVIRFLNSLLWPFLIILGDLMDVDMIIGPGMEDRMIAIYNNIRDLVNIAFVLVLIAVAFYNVLGLGGGEGELAIKTALPKVVLGLILVNFTLPIGRVLLDVTNVGTNIAFGLPNVVKGYEFGTELENFTNDVCYKDHYVDSSSGIEISTPYSTADTTNTPIQTQFLCQDSDGDGGYDSLNSVISTTYFQDLNKNNLGLIMAVNMGKLGALNILKQGTINNFEDLTVNMMYATVMFLIFAISYIVMGIVLLTRIFVLWIALALSPLAVLVYVVPQVKEWAGGAGDFSQKVIKHLISPIIMGITMSFGYLLMDAWNNVSQGSTNALGSLAVNNVISAQFLVSGIDDLPKFILAIASIVVIWTGIFAAASGTIAEGVTGTIKGFGERVRDAALKAPLLIPSVPIGVKEGKPQNVSPLGVIGLADAGLRKIEYGNFGEEEARKIASTGGFEGFLFGGTGPGAGEKDPRKNADAIAEALRNSGNQITPATISDIASRLYNNVQGNSSLKKEDQQTTMTELSNVMKLSQQGKGDEALTSLRRIVDNNKDDKILKLEGQYRDVTQMITNPGLRTIPNPATPSANTPPAGGTQTPPANTPPSGTAAPGPETPVASGTTTTTTTTTSGTTPPTPPTGTATTTPTPTTNPTPPTGTPATPPSPPADPTPTPTPPPPGTATPPPAGTP